MPKIGVLAIQGDYAAHAGVLHHLGIEPRFVRLSEDLTGLDGIILPGGESSTHLKVLTEEGLFDKLKQFAANGGACFGTCAGAILLAREVRGPQQASLGLLDVKIQRNSYGRQLSSEVRMGTTKLSPEPLEMVFIRAPIIESAGPSVETLADEGSTPVLVQQGRILASTFHPELTSNTMIHKHFLAMASSR